MDGGGGGGSSYGGGCDAETYVTYAGTSQSFSHAQSRSRHLVFGTEIAARLTIHNDINLQLTD